MSVATFIIAGRVISWNGASKFDEVTLLRYGIQPPFLQHRHLLCAVKAVIPGTGRLRKLITSN